ncbi:glutathione hydrolase 1 proenzyme-like isoform X1 [Arctopsyche grandis]
MSIHEFSLSGEEKKRRFCFRPENKKYNIIVIVFIIILCIALAVYFTVSGAKKGKILFTPPDPEEPLPASNSILHTFKTGAVCTDGPPCSDIGRDILKRNGSAIDATIAAMFCNGVVNMHSMGLGGGFLMTIYTKSTRQAITLNAREVAPLAASKDMYKDNPKAAKQGPLSVAVPGELLGYWEAYQRFGVLPWKDLIAPTLKLCETGYMMTKSQWDSLPKSAGILGDSNLREMFYNNNTHTLKNKGETIKPSTAYCNTLKIIAEKGGNELYNGSLATKFAEELKEAGSIITREDLEQYKVKWSPPINTSLGEDKLFTVPPPGSGAILGFILNILSNYNLNKGSIASDESSILTYHRIIEAFKYAYAQRTLLGDMDFVNITDVLKNLTSAEFAKNTQLQIHDNETFSESKHYGANFINKADRGTAHISVLAPNGDAVSVTSTINFYFGAGFTTKETGIIMNSCMDDFSSPGFSNIFGLPGSPANLIEPGKRAMSSMSPSIIVDKDFNVKMVIGASGGTKITTAVALVIMRTFWFEQTIKQAVDAPRIHHQLEPKEVSYEYGNTKQILKGLQKIGHKLERYEDRGSIICSLYKNATGIHANADYRKGGDVSGLDH